jgi:hypothetical protein
MRVSKSKGEQEAFADSQNRLMESWNEFKKNETRISAEKNDRGLIPLFVLAVFLGVVLGVIIMYIIYGTASNSQRNIVISAYLMGYGQGMSICTERFSACTEGVLSESCYVAVKEARG